MAVRGQSGRGGGGVRLILYVIRTPCCDEVVMSWIFLFCKGRF